MLCKRGREGGRERERKKACPLDFLEENIISDKVPRLDIKLEVPAALREGHARGIASGQRERKNR